MKAVAIARIAKAQRIVSTSNLLIEVPSRGRCHDPRTPVDPRDRWYMIPARIPQESAVLVANKTAIKTR